MLAYANRKESMIPLIIAEGKKNLFVKQVVSDDKTKRHLENLGILKGSELTLIQSNHGHVIVKVKEGRLALNQELASRIYVE